MGVKLELYRVFREVAEAGNITAAAQNLFISQSAVSQSIKQLESDLQTRLFARNSRGVSLTPDGKMLYEYVRSAMGLLETGEEKLSQSRQLQVGHLTIGASDTVTSQFLLPYLDRFHRQYPGVHIQIISGRSHKVLGLPAVWQGGHRLCQYAPGCQLPEHLPLLRHPLHFRGRSGLRLRF